MQIAGSLIAILLLAFLAHHLFPAIKSLDEMRVKRNITRFCPEVPRQIIDDAVIFIDYTKGKAIVLLGTEWGFAVVIQLGDRLTVRHIKEAATADIKEIPGGISIDTRDITFPRFTLSLADSNKKQLIDALHSQSLILLDKEPEASHA